MAHNSAIAAVTSEDRVEVCRLAVAWDNPWGRAVCRTLEAFTASLPPATIIHSRRNCLYRVRVLDRTQDDVVIKRFPVRQAIRQAIYTLRSSKAQRSFDNAARLLDLGIHTPEPLAAVEVWRGHLPVTSYYCCRWQDHWALARNLRAASDPAGLEAVRALGEFVGRLHDLGVLHNDLSAGNVLVGREEVAPGTFRFSLVDLNRMHFRPVGMRMGLANLTQLGPFAGGTTLLDGYCEQRSLSLRAARIRYEALLRLRSATWILKNGTRGYRRKLGL